MLFKANAMRISLTVFLMVYGSSLFAAEPAWLTSMISECDSGVTKECLDVGVAYTRGELKGKKVVSDKAKAKHYINKGVKQGQQNCLQGDPMDCYTLGLLFFQGGGVVPADIPRGIEFLERSCRGGYGEACAWLDNSGLGGGNRRKR